MKYEKFNDWPEAFDTCRERNRPVAAAVAVDDQGLGPMVEVSTVFPSGHSKRHKLTNVPESDWPVGWECVKDWTDGATE